MSKKILIISRAYPPAGGGGVQRIVKFSIYLQEMGWDVTVCSIKGENYSWIDEARLKEISDIKTIRLKEKPYKGTLLNKVINKFRFYDYYYKWAKDVIKHFKNKKEFDYDYVLTSGPPHSVHKIGLELKKKFNFFLVTDFRDPFTLGAFYHPITPLHKFYQKKFEQIIYDKSDLIITNTNVNKKEVLRYFSIKDDGKLKTIYNGYDSKDLQLHGVKPNFDKEKINLLYLGGLRGDRVDGYFYKTIKKAIEINPLLFQKVKVNLVGDLSRKGNMIEELNLVQLFNFYDALPYNRVGDYLLESDGCITWQSPDKGYNGTIAGKVFDYFGMEKPIFSLGQPEGELNDLINNFEIGIHSDVNNIETAAMDFIRFVNNIDKYSLSYRKMEKSKFNFFNRKQQALQLNNYLLNIN
ncbi:hypothetical protein EGM88_14390 [Aureibaculum marinum]|uniref:Glycosyltransferase subfamily 4-like N-terminal domain-containing protein n=1 Tax=Aureibaculum marinum TaxID=2487930 RepID=A0A3N4N5Y2_9FLAO|nr:glycosyltransferase [Aureibaculum marinum]RPD91724.1 hypothetical protein EGM88_14390 [Aureibaculum marinum]